MSGTKVVPILSAHKDVYIHSGPAYKLGGSTSAPAGGGARLSNVVGGVEYELLLCAGAIYKIGTPQSAQQPLPAVALAASVSLASESSASFAKKKPMPTADAPSQPAKMIWRTTLCNVLHVYPVSDWYKAASKPAQTGSSISPSSSAAAVPPECGFVVEFISDKPSPKKISKYPEWAQHHIKLLTDAQQGVHRQTHLRYRFFACQSGLDQQEWLTMLAAAQCNYWHERLEKTIIPDPDVYQFHSWAVESGETRRLVHLVVSTAQLIAVPIPTNGSMRDDGTTASRQAVNIHGISRCLLGRGDAANSMKVSARPPAPILEGGVVFFSAAIAIEFAVELQRVWGITQKEEPFPLE